MTQTVWQPGLEFAVPEEAPLPWETAVYVPTIHLFLSFLGAMCACPPFPCLCWSLMITVQAPCFLTFCPPYPGLRSLVSMPGKYWVVAYHSAKMGFRSRVWEEEALCLCMFDTSLRSGLFQLWKGMFLGRSDMAGLLPGKRSQGPEDCTNWWSLSSCSVLASYVKFPLDVTLYCLPWWVVRIIHERRIWSLSDCALLDYLL